MQRTSDAPLPIFARIDHVCAISGLSRSRVYLLLGQGVLRAKKDASTTLVEISTVVSYLNSLPPATFGADREAA